MAHFGARSRSWSLGTFSFVLGLLGLTLCWWTPDGDGVEPGGPDDLALVGCAMARRDGWAPAAAGMILSAAGIAGGLLVRGGQRDGVYPLFGPAVNGRRTPQRSAAPTRRFSVGVSRTHGARSRAEGDKIQDDRNDGRASHPLRNG